MSTLPETTVFGGIVAIGVAAITALVSFFGGRNSATAILQTSLTDGFKVLAEMYERERLMDQKRIVDLEGEVRNLKATLEAVYNILRENGIEVPKHRPVEVITVLDQTKRKR